MVESSGPNLGSALARVHLVVTRGLDVALDRCRAYGMDGFPDERTRHGLAAYIQTLVLVLDAHHLGEDELAFPYFRDKLPAVPYDELMAEHQRLLPLLAEIKAAAAEMVAGVEADPDLGVLRGALEHARALWHPHRSKEEAHLSPQATATVMDRQEQLRMVKVMAEFNGSNSQPAYLSVPFILFNLPPAERAAMAQGMPPAVTQELVPGPWRELWAPMKPFLLE